MKIAVFENEYDSVRGAFDTANLMEFNNKLEIANYTSSQIVDFQLISEFEAIFIDIDLSSKSEMDGFGVINKIKEIDDKLSNRIIILTGNNKIKEAMIEREVQDSRIQIIIKPTDYEEIAKKIRNIKIPRITEL